MSSLFAGRGGKLLAAMSSSNGGVSLGSGDVGVLNYAFALEQLEAEFYSLVAKSFYAGIGSRERQILTDIRDHEIAHADFYRAALGSAGIPALQFNSRP